MLRVEKLTGEAKSERETKRNRQKAVLKVPVSAFTQCKDCLACTSVGISAE
jgi:hypothetical protein